MATFIGGFEKTSKINPVTPAHKPGDPGKKQKESPVKPSKAPKKDPPPAREKPKHPGKIDVEAEKD